ncbi:MAG TPA: 16S rRNA (cytidine(1402)-2'-O)-methyltransferase [Candidatus Paceibacterota bacterium]
MPKLYIVATPIGNLKDITLRALDVLREVDLVLAEDTRVTKKLLAHYDIKTALFSFHKFSPKSALKKIQDFLESGKNIALVTDAGTPGISDPGQWLIAEILAQRSFGDISILPIPGPSSLSAILSVSDIDCSQFVFLGFPPHKKGRQTFFKKVAQSEIPIILFESPHRIQKTLKELEVTVGDRYCNVGRELTKIYEEIFRGKFSEAQKHFVGEKQRGEFVIILSNA